jgi:RNA polymerase sigma-70 factor (ECF subfamily)
MPPAESTSEDTVTTRLVVRDALARLPLEQRAALVLVDLEGHSVAEAALILDVAEGTVKSRCARGRARLAVLLGHLRDDDGRDTRHDRDAGNQSRPASVPPTSRRTEEGT